MTTATAQASPNIAFIKLVQWDTVFGHGKACFAHISGIEKINLQA
jgi:hypothetical protein